MENDERNKQIVKIDEIYITTALPYEERIKILKKLFLNGIDKGTLLEDIKRKHLEVIKRNIKRKRFNRLMDYWGEIIAKGTNKNYRKKYRDPKYKPKKQIEQEKKMQEAYDKAMKLTEKQLPLWLVK